MLKKYRQHIINFVKGNNNNIKAQKKNGTPTGYLYLNKLWDRKVSSFVFTYVCLLYIFLWIFQFSFANFARQRLFWHFQLCAGNCRTAGQNRPPRACPTFDSCVEKSSKQTSEKPKKFLQVLVVFLMEATLHWIVTVSKKQITWQRF